MVDLQEITSYDLTKLLNMTWSIEIVDFPNYIFYNMVIFHSYVFLTRG